MLQLGLIATFVLLCLLFFFSIIYLSTRSESSSLNNSKLPRSYPLIGSIFAVFANRNQRHQWLTEVIRNSPTGTFVLHRTFGQLQIFTANPANVQHILKTHFNFYPKGELSNTIYSDFLGSGIFNADGDNWKLQRQISSHEFNTKSIRKFVQTVVETELSDRLLPILAGAATTTESVIDLQNILERFTFDNICKIAFGFDPEFLLPSLPPTEFAVAFELATMESSNRFIAMFPAIWKVKRALDIGSEKYVRQAVSQVREFAQNMVKKKKHGLNAETDDLLSRLLNSCQLSETLVTDMVISFILAGRDTTSAALTWFFWLVSQNSHVEKEILSEIREKSKSPNYEEVKDMVYIHASLCESMRLFPPVAADTKVAASDDILPDGTLVKKGMRVTYHIYAMGRMEKLWGLDWPEYRPERWLEKDNVTGKWNFIPKDAYAYPVFQAGPRVCLGKDMAFLQMKKIVAGVLRHFRVVPIIDKGSEPVYNAFITSKMIGGFQVRIEQRGDQSL
ncbi:Cytochrome p450 [Thalictrum thalictroides]|uniref:Cytochrome p450 n=1 Tax=Thalictrum thalictroides TaxID=46969 RepID=A0A7J6WW70_THATH|nr:Cytochrome p450 [Thalictrum thalictroides]